MESNFKGTKGPWEIGDENNSSCDVSLPNGSDISLSRYERNTGDFVMEREEMRANMYLIAAAPLLLEALQNCISHVSDFYPEYKQAKHAINAALGIKGE